VRTTVNIDEHLLAEAKVRAARSHRSIGDVIDEALRLRFATDERPAGSVSLPTFGVPGERLLVDIEDRDAVAEALGDNAGWSTFGSDDAHR
jgi:plasmid stability protein